MSIYERINSIRKQKGVTWTYLNEKVDGAYHGRMTDLKNGKTTLSHSQLETVAKILDTSTDYLLGNTDDPSAIGQKEKPPAQGGEPVGPNKRALLDLVDAMSEEEMGPLLELVKAMLKMRDGK